jgi:diphthamide biosynthesis protein 2
MAEQLTTAPVLSTPETHIFEDPTPILIEPKSQRLTDHELHEVYEIARTAEEIARGGWKKIALQFPDHMLTDAPRVFEALEKKLVEIPQHAATREEADDTAEKLQELDINKGNDSDGRRRLFILADTSYGACCVDEIAAEHADAEVVVHYGRSCLSPTARLPVIYVYTTRLLSHEPVIAAFKETFPEKDTKIILMADITYDNHVKSILNQLQEMGYTDTFAPEIVHDPSSMLPNRTIPPAVATGDAELRDYQLFHISDPPPALLLTLSSRLQAMHIFPTTSASAKTLEANTSMTLRRRYALVTRLSTCGVFGILINTLSVKNYLSTITKLQEQIAAAGKKSYTFVVGKVNAAKVANFSEIGGWVVVGCWESSLIESTDFYRPIITPFELGLCLQSDDERLWTGEWSGDFSGILKENILKEKVRVEESEASADQEGHGTTDGLGGDFEDEEESAPPEFDFRTGRYVSHSRPMREYAATTEASSSRPGKPAHALVKRVNGELATVNGAVSPGAEYLRSQRTWTGLGSDFEIAYEDDGVEKGSAVEEGRSGVARGYTVGDDAEKR